MSESPFTKKQLQVLSLIEKYPDKTYEVIETDEKLSKSFISNNVRTARNRVRKARNVVNVALSMGRRSSRVRGALI